MIEETVTAKLNELVAALTEITDLELRNRLARSAVDHIRSLIPSSYDRVLAHK